MLVCHPCHRPLTLLVGGLLTGLVACTTGPTVQQPEPSASPPVVSSGSPSPITSASPTATGAGGSTVATVAEIRRTPVFVRPLHPPQEQPASEGMGLQIGETVRTQGQALTEIDLANGLAFRLGGNSILTLQPNSRLQLTAGEMITWVQPNRTVPAEIVTPAATAGIRGTTVYVKIPANTQDGTLFFAWEGAVALRLPGQAEEIMLKTAEELRIRPGERDIRQLRRRIRRLNRAEWRRLRQQDRLVHGFRRPLPTLAIINRIRPGQVTPDPLPRP